MAAAPRCLTAADAPPPPSSPPAREVLTWYERELANYGVTLTTTGAPVMPAHDFNKDYINQPKGQAYLAPAAAQPVQFLEPRKEAPPPVQTVYIVAAPPVQQQYVQPQQRASQHMSHHQQAQHRVQQRHAGPNWMAAGAGAGAGMLARAGMGAMTSGAISVFMPQMAAAGLVSKYGVGLGAGVLKTAGSAAIRTAAMGLFRH